jgi:hypothetical protein
VENSVLNPGYGEVHGEKPKCGFRNGWRWCAPRCRGARHRGTGESGDSEHVWWKTAVFAEPAALATETGFLFAEIEATLQALAWWSDNGRGITLSAGVVCEQPAYAGIGWADAWERLVEPV